MQGSSQSLFEICVSSSVLCLWSGISNSPINGAQAGYGVGALIAVFISKPFVKYSRLFNSHSNSSTMVVNETKIVSSVDITLQVPYSIAGLIGVLVSLAFIFAQYFESKNTERLDKIMENDIEVKENNLSNQVEKYKTNIIKSKAVITFLLIILAMSIGGFSIVFVNFLLTYATQGPAKLSIATYFKTQTLFWIFNIFGRVTASFVAYRVDVLFFFFILILSNFICLFLYAMPYFNSIKEIYFIIIVILSLFSAPVIPSFYMMLKYIMGHVSSILIALFGISMAAGAIAGQYITGYLLDEFKPSPNWFNYTDATSVYIIPIIVLVNVFVSFFVLIILIIVFKNMKKNKL